LESDRKIARFDLRLLPRTEQLVSVTALIIFFASGFSALLYQVIWQRMLGFFSGADVYSVTIIVAAYMAGMGVGSLTGGYLADRFSRRGNLALFASVELGIALFALGSKGLYYDWLYQRLAFLASSPPLMAVVLFFSLLIPTFCMGVSLPALARALTRSIERAAGTIGALYGVNTLGAAVGAGVTTWIFLRKYSFETILYIGAEINALVALTAFPLAWFLMQQTVARADLDRTLWSFRIHCAVAGDSLVSHSGSDAEIDGIYLWYTPHHFPEWAGAGHVPRHQMGGTHP